MPKRDNTRNASPRTTLAEVDIDTAAKRLANAHYTIEPSITHIYRLGGGHPDDRTIRLLEINPDTIPTDRIVPVGFGPDAPGGMPYPSVIIEVTPEEFRKLETGEWSLPEGWRRRDLFKRPATKTPVQKK